MFILLVVSGLLLAVDHRQLETCVNAVEITYCATVFGSTGPCLRLKLVPTNVQFIYERRQTVRVYLASAARAAIESELCLLPYSTEVTGEYGIISQLLLECRVEHLPEDLYK